MDFDALRKELAELKQARVAAVAVLIIGLAFGWTVATTFYGERLALMEQQVSALQSTVTATAAVPGAWSASWPLVAALGSLGVLILALLAFLFIKRQKPTQSAEPTLTEGPLTVEELNRRFRLVKPERVVGHKFINETVQLDGRIFEQCEFINVTLAFDGTAPFDIVRPVFPPDGSLARTSSSTAIAMASYLSDQMRNIGLGAPHGGSVTSGVQDERGHITPIITIRTAPPKLRPEDRSKLVVLFRAHGGPAFKAAMHALSQILARVKASDREQSELVARLLTQGADAQARIAHEVHQLVEAPAAETQHVDMQRNFGWFFGAYQWVCAWVQQAGAVVDGLQMSNEQWYRRWRELDDVFLQNLKETIAHDEMKELRDAVEVIGWEDNARPSI